MYVLKHSFVKFINSFKNKKYKAENFCFIFLKYYLTVIIE